jgi:dUTP pyrophosphatase
VSISDDYPAVDLTQAIEGDLPVFYTMMPHAVQPPAYKTLGASGGDLYAAEAVTLYPGSPVMVPTGIRIALSSARFEAQVRSRSGLAANHGVFVLNSPGTIDSDYRGELKVIMMNAGRVPYKVRRGDRIAQLVFAKVWRGSFVKCEEDKFDEFTTERSSGGFGSTGK